MIVRAKVKVTRTFSTKMLDNLAMLGDMTLRLRRDVGPHQKMTQRAKVMVMVTIHTKKLIIRQCLRLEHLNLEGCWS